MSAPARRPQAKAIVDVADEEMVGADVAGKADRHRQSGAAIDFVVRRRERVEFDDGEFWPLPARALAVLTTTEVLPTEGGPATVITRMGSSVALGRSCDSWNIRQAALIAAQSSDGA